ncbi:MAG: hypothetical protein K6U03_10605, partial [Firmicutes bacterium]|nr:hypothetical protein [Bacillota bacterium]
MGRRRAISTVFFHLLLALAALPFAAGPALALELSPPSSISLSYRDGCLYPLSAAVSWEISGYEMDFGWLPLD